ncbi:MAG: alpha-keto acid decarboxylase family protein, partial [Propionibacteriaceae bacterium]
MGMAYTVSDHLLDRLHELGADHLFGVPGDYNLGFLDTVLAHPGVAWVGCTNELNAAYAADGYARLAGVGAVLTTYGVGELSALNGVAGAYAENVGVVQITGAPATSLMRAGMDVHHSFADGDWERFARMYREVTCADVFLDAENACDLIDDALRRCRDERLPVHLTLPSDVAGVVV